MADKRTKAELLAALEGLAKENAANAARLNNAKIAYRSLQKQYMDLAEQLKNRNTHQYITIKQTISSYNQATGQIEELKSVLAQSKGYVDWVNKTLYVSKDFTRSDGSHGSEVETYVFKTCRKGDRTGNFYGKISTTKVENTSASIELEYSIDPPKDYSKKKNKDNK